MKMNVKSIREYLQNPNSILGYFLIMGALTLGIIGTKSTIDNHANTIASKRTIPQYMAAELKRSGEKDSLNEVSSFSRYNGTFIDSDGNGWCATLEEPNPKNVPANSKLESKLVLRNCSSNQDVANEFKDESLDGYVNSGILDINSFISRTPSPLSLAFGFPSTGYSPFAQNKYEKTIEKIAKNAGDAVGYFHNFARGHKKIPQSK